MGRGAIFQKPVDQRKNRTARQRKREANATNRGSRVAKRFDQDSITPVLGPTHFATSQIPATRRLSALSSGGNAATDKAHSSQPEPPLEPPRHSLDRAQPQTLHDFITRTTAALRLRSSHSSICTSCDNSQQTMTMSTPKTPAVHAPHSVLKIHAPQPRVPYNNVAHSVSDDSDDAALRSATTGFKFISAKLVPENHLAYKTAPCKHWTKNGGWCPLDDLCCFIHDEALRWIEPTDSGDGQKSSPALSDIPSRSSLSSTPLRSLDSRQLKHPSSPTRKQKTSHCWAFVQGRCAHPVCDYAHPEDVTPYIKYTPCSRGRSCPLPHCPFKHPTPPPWYTDRRACIPSPSNEFSPEVPYGTVYFPIPLEALVRSPSPVEFTLAPPSVPIRMSTPNGNPIVTPTQETCRVSSLLDGLPVLPSRAVVYMQEASARTRKSHARRVSLGFSGAPRAPQVGAGHARRASESGPRIRSAIEESVLISHPQTPGALPPLQPRAAMRPPLRIVTAAGAPACTLEFPHTASATVFPSSARFVRGHARRISVAIKTE